jgi:phosphoribosylformylglycinamidine synthase II
VSAPVVCLVTRPLGPDPRSARLAADARAAGLAGVRSIACADLTFVAGELDDAARRRLADELLADPLLHDTRWRTAADDAGGLRVVETALHPGVTDTAAAEVVRAAQLLGLPVVAAASGRRYEIDGDLDDAELDRLVRRLLANPVIERWTEGAIAPAFATDSPASVDTVQLVPLAGLDDAALTAVNVARGLALDPAELRAVQAWFASIGRAPTDVELETLAQTWSEHCSHKTFRATITLTDGTEVTPLIAQLRATTDAIAAPWVRSAFVGNAGIVDFDAGHVLAIKAETHNHPSAVEPFGGANTGVGGVLRDILGVSAKPIAATDVLCFGPAGTEPDSLPDGVIHPRQVRQGVVAGVADYGNKLGVPTVAGAVLYDPGYIANPLVYAGCVGVAKDTPALGGPFPGDLVVVMGGRTGRDGLRGATFSSATMDATTGDVAGASVQIGDPIVEKLVIDVMRESDGLFSAVTDCGAGGLSSAVGEMAEGVGADVDVLHAPLKYPGLRPWEIWLSEAQERMVFAVPPRHWHRLVEVCGRHGVDVCSIGTFTGDGVLRVRAGDVTVLELDTHFLHDGRPQRSMVAELPTPRRGAASAPECTDPAGTLLALLAHPNIASKERVIRRYDHEIRGATVVRPLVGAAHDGHADGVVLAEPGDRHGIALGIGVNPWFGLADPEHMAHSVVDEAIRNVVAVGADPDMIVLLDNFSWGDPRRPTTLGELAMAVQGCCDAAHTYSSPFVSGKDSLNNEYLGSDGQRHAVPPTLVITAMAHVPDADRTVTPDLRHAGNALVQVGETKVEFAGSHFEKIHGPTDGVVPAPVEDPLARYRALHRAILDGLVQSCHDLSEGGLAVAVAEMAIAGRLGARLHTLPHADPTTALFSESNGRFICEIAHIDLDTFLTAVPGSVVVGEVTADAELAAPGWSVPLADLVIAFKGAAR